MWFTQGMYQASFTFWPVSNKCVRIRVTKSKLVEQELKLYYPGKQNGSRPRTVTLTLPAMHINFRTLITVGLCIYIFSKLLWLQRHKDTCTVCVHGNTDTHTSRAQPHRPFSTDSFNSTHYLLLSPTTTNKQRTKTHVDAWLLTTLLIKRVEKAELNITWNMKTLKKIYSIWLRLQEGAKKKKEKFKGKLKLCLIEDALSHINKKDTRQWVELVVSK